MTGRPEQLVADSRNRQKISVLPLIPERWTDLESVVGRSGDSGCWCMWWRLGDEQFEEQRGQANKIALREIVEAIETILSGEKYASRKVVGLLVD
jgi:hypothetical protein